LSLLLTFTLWLTINYLGDPVNGIIVAVYIVSWLMSGAFLSIGICMSAMTKNQVVAFTLSVVVCLVFVVSDSNIVLDTFKSWAPSEVIDVVASFSFLTHFEPIVKGVIALNDLIYFLLVTICWLFAGLVIIEQKKAD
jgi:ABC-2 type transport system permease protein